MRAKQYVPSDRCVGSPRRGSQSADRAACETGPWTAPCPRVRTPCLCLACNAHPAAQGLRSVPHLARSFGGLSPERIASKELRRFFTFVSAR